MKFSETKRIFQDWKKFGLIKEVTEEELGHVKAALKKAMDNPSVLPFDKQFNGKLRMIVPIKYNPYDDQGTIGQMLNTLIASGWSVDLNSGLVTKEFEREFEGVKRVQKRQMKINAVWTTLLDLLGKHDKASIEAYKKSPDVESSAQYAAENPEIQKIENQITSLMGEAVKDNFVEGMSYKVAKQRIEAFITTWQKDADKIKGKMESGGSDFTVLMSRNPVDILRMSDFQHITSCHSPVSIDGEGGSYYKCAVAEARAGGLIAYLVNANSVSKIDLEQPEIFSDEKRDIQGITPIARVRLRYVNDPVTQTYLAVPERKIYGPDFKGFMETVDQWALDSQAKEVSKFISNIDNNEFNLDQFHIIGGTYVERYDDEKNNLKVLFSKMFEKIPEFKDVKIVGQTHVSGEIEREVEADIGHPLEQSAKLVINEFNYEMIEKRIPLQCYEHWSVSHWGTRPAVNPELFFFETIDPESYYYSVEADEKLFSEKTANLIKRQLGKEGYVDYADMVRIIKFTDATRICIFPSESFLLEEYLNKEMITDTDILKQYLNTAQEVYNSDVRKEIFFIANKVLKEIGALRSTPFAEMLEQIESKTFDSDWIFTDVDTSTNLTSVNGELTVIIPYSSIGITSDKEASKFTNKRFSDMIKSDLLYGKKSLRKSINKDLYIFYVKPIVLANKNSILFSIHLEFTSEISPDAFRDLYEMYKNPTSFYEKKILELISKQTGVNPVQTTNKLQEFKHVSSLWKKFIF